MNWADATYLSATDRVLLDWAKEMWWHMWIKQSHTNYVGMWNKKFEKEDRGKERQREEEKMKAKELEAKNKAEELVKANKERIMMRLKAMNMSFGGTKET